MNQSSIPEPSSTDKLGENVISNIRAVLKKEMRPVPRQQNVNNLPEQIK